MADLKTNIGGIESPNPFWLASAPPTNEASMVMRAFEHGWGGAVWKTLGDPVINVSSRLASFGPGPQRMMGLNNLELITDRPWDVNLAEITEVKRRHPDRALVVSLMVASKREAWHEAVKQVQDTGADGLELNFGCPHGMSERGMGSAVGQVPDYTEMITAWVKEVSSIPVLVKLTPNVTDITAVARAARRGGADGVSLINTVNSVMGVDLESLVPYPDVDGKSAHGGYCGPAIKPIALHMVSAIARDPELSGVPISGIGGIQNWRDAAEFLALGASGVQVCTAVMHYGYRIIEEMMEGLDQYLEEQGMASVGELVGASVHRVTDWGRLNLKYATVARVEEEHCIRCNLCYVACRDGAHQCIDFVQRNGARYPCVSEEECVGCNLCYLVCPSPGAIEMVRVDRGRESLSWDELAERGLPAPERRTRPGTFDEV
jgi:dihydropyrimidine dehydrogenase (NAD+) subunit PreA